MSHEMPAINGLLVLPRLRVQNANAISSPLTWGFPALTAFTGFMQALERRLGGEVPFVFQSVGVICHGFEPQTTEGGFTRAFRLTRNPVNADGSSAALVEEGRAHLDITLVFGVDGTKLDTLDATQRPPLAQRVADTVAGMRLAGGSVMPALAHGAGVRRQRPELLPWPLHHDSAEQDKAWQRLRQRWLPGFALVSREELLAQRLAQLRDDDPQATLLEAWLDASRLNHHAVRASAPDGSEQVSWQRTPRPGWIVPIPVGYAALTAEHAPGTVASARDRSVPFRFVESVYSLGQWISPHRLGSAQDLLWWSDFDPGPGLYRCRNRCSTALPQADVLAAGALPEAAPDSAVSPFVDA